ncbi:MAG TPA: GntR family transcriptional regulator [Candidatus Cloacimonadota bacterium]|nr:GntR family transcriptional regulator [Candidatus Cloacimonadota bacterium]HOD55108.1 GntR family transcriptional regulator [Candidatus Cloacimonadota bacterium]HPM02384.1 GntR family transcriptional regulator [Candidatus Cloacimonadota bacterium]
MNAFKSDMPIYLQIREYIETAILDGSLKEEESLPSLRQLAKDHVLNPITISNAINLLENDDILYKKRGIGVFVQKNARKKIISKKSKDFLNNSLSTTIVKAKLLEIPVETLFDCIRKIYGENNV